MSKEILYKPLEEQTGPDVGYKDDGSDTKYQVEKIKPKKTKRRELK